MPALPDGKGRLEAGAPRDQSLRDWAPRNVRDDNFCVDGNDVRRGRNVARLERNDVRLLVDRHFRRIRQLQAVAVRAFARTQVENISVPRASNPPVHDSGLIEWPKPMRAYRCMGDDLIAEGDQPPHLAAKADDERQSRSHVFDRAKLERLRRGGMFRTLQAQLGLALTHHRFIFVPETRIKLEISFPIAFNRSSSDSVTKNPTFTSVSSRPIGASCVRTSLPSPTPSIVRTT